MTTLAAVSAATLRTGELVNNNDGTVTVIVQFDMSDQAGRVYRDCKIPVIVSATNTLASIAANIVTRVNAATSAV